jgi:hypothetical protein
MKRRSSDVTGCDTRRGGDGDGIRSVLVLDSEGGDDLAEKDRFAGTWESNADVKGKDASAHENGIQAYRAGRCMRKMVRETGQQARKKRTSRTSKEDVLPVLDDHIEDLLLLVWQFDLALFLLALALLEVRLGSLDWTGRNPLPGPQSDGQAY